MKIPKRKPESLKGLEDYINYLDSIKPVKDMVIVEIGCWVGVSTELFAKRFKAVIAIDPFKPTYDTISSQYDMNEVFKEYEKRISKYKNIWTVKKRSVSASKDLKNILYDVNKELGFNLKKIDVVYIDGDHHYNAVKKDIENWKDKAWIVSGHDYENRFPGVIKAVNEVYTKPLRVFNDTTWIGAINV